MKRRIFDDAKPARELCEEAYHLLRAASLEALGAYYLGAIPFCLGMIYFANVMEVHPFAAEMLAGLSLGIALLWIWMKAWQARFAQILRAQLRGEAAPAWTWRSGIATACRQAALQLAGLVLLPFAMLLVVPMARFYGFSQCVTALDSDTEQSIAELYRAAREESGRWMFQAHLLIWTLSPILVLSLMGVAWFVPVAASSTGIPLTDILMMQGGFVVLLILGMALLSPLAFALSLNLLAMVAFTSMLLKALLDVDTVFTLLPSLLGSRSFLCIWMALVYLCMDPILKTAYVLRCYYGNALSNGDDLRAAMRRSVQRAAMLVLLVTIGMLGAGTATAEAAAPQGSPAPNAEDINHAIRTELDKAAYQWRLPRDLGLEETQASGGLFLRSLKSIANWAYNTLNAIWEWAKALWKRVFGMDRDGPAAADGSGGITHWVGDAMELIALVMFVVLALAVGLFAFRQWRALRQEAAELLASDLPQQVEVEDESTEATALPEEAWRQMADEFYAKGDYRLAMRALFLSLLSALSDRELITVRRYKSNAAYIRELASRLQRGHGAVTAFREGTLAYECVWYGEHPASAESFATLLHLHQQARNT